MGYGLKLAMIVHLPVATHYGNFEAGFKVWYSQVFVSMWGEIAAQ